MPRRGLAALCLLANAACATSVHYDLHPRAPVSAPGDEVQLRLTGVSASVATGSTPNGTVRGRPTYRATYSSIAPRLEIERDGAQWKALCVAPCTATAPPGARVRVAASNPDVIASPPITVPAGYDALDLDVPALGVQSNRDSYWLVFGGTGGGLMLIGGGLAVGAASDSSPRPSSSKGLELAGGIVAGVGLLACVAVLAMLATDDGVRTKVVVRDGASLPSPLAVLTPRGLVW